MSAYQPGVPSGLLNLDVDYLNLKNNFQQLDTTFGVDHTLFSNQTAQNGYHTSIHMIPQAAPVNVPGYGQLYSNTVNDGINTDQSLYFQTGTGDRNLLLTRNFTPVLNTNGYTFMPGGLIIQWGNVNAPGGGPSAVTFPLAFPNAIYSVQLTARNDGSHSAFTYYLDGAPTITAFTYRGSTTGSNTLFWIALGN